jgi:hypothetical protein
MWPYSEKYEQEYVYNYSVSESMYSSVDSGAMRIHSPRIAAAQTHTSYLQQTVITHNT